jgi:hypothetical protein
MAANPAPASPDDLISERAVFDATVRLLMSPELADALGAQITLSQSRALSLAASMIAEACLHAPQS